MSHGWHKEPRCEVKPIEYGDEGPVITGCGFCYSAACPDGIAQCEEAEKSTRKRYVKMTRAGLHRSRVASLTPRMGGFVRIN